MNFSYTGRFGPELTSDGVRFRLWAPAARRVQLVVNEDDGERRLDLDARDDGWFEVVDSAAAVGTGYRFAIDEDPLLVPDPASRYQPEGVHGPSEIVDPAAFAWPELRTPRPQWNEMVFYELHVGTFTPQGTYAAAIEHLDGLAETGITAIELMPLAQAPGARNWGYDGVLPYAPNNVYGTPGDLKHFIAEAHARGLAVFLDVVYNHFGPEGNFLHRYAPQFFTERHHTPWGAALDFNAPASEPVRAFFIENACYWLQEYQFDGLRLDATHAIFDERSLHFLDELATTAKQAADHEVHLVVENDANEIRWIENGFRAQWNDDVHHALHVLATGEREEYYTDYAVDPIGMLGRALTTGYGFQGEVSAFRGGITRGAPTAHLRLGSFVNFLQNHDQIGNRPFGERITSFAPPAAVRAALAVLLLAPSPPLLFMGDEWGASTPFLYFCDFEPELARAVSEGRKKEFAVFERLTGEGHTIPDATDPATFERSKLDWAERDEPEHRAWLAYYAALLHARRTQIAPYIADVRGTAATFERVGAAGLSAAWKLDDGRMLRVEANLQDREERGFTERADEGAVIFGPARFASGVAPAWSVRWTLS